jgi:hypothetical protein
LSVAGKVCEVVVVATVEAADPDEALAASARVPRTRVLY